MHHHHYPPLLCGIDLCPNFQIWRSTNPDGKGHRGVYGRDDISSSFRESRQRLKVWGGRRRGRGANRIDQGMSSFCFFEWPCFLIEELIYYLWSKILLRRNINYHPNLFKIAIFAFTADKYSSSIFFFSSIVFCMFRFPPFTYNYRLFAFSS